LHPSRFDEGEGWDGLEEHDAEEGEEDVGEVDPHHHHHYHHHQDYRYSERDREEGRERTASGEVLSLHSDATPGEMVEGPVHHREQTRNRQNGSGVKKHTKEITERELKGEEGGDRRKASRKGPNYLEEFGFHSSSPTQLETDGNNR
jgi:hypothetical protein